MKRKASDKLHEPIFGSKNRRIAIVVFGRAPRRGQVKTRLAADIGVVAAAALYAAMLRDCLALATDFSTGAATDKVTPNCKVTLAFTPAQAFADEFDSGPHPLRNMWMGVRQAQMEGDLGAKMAHALNYQLGSGADQVILIGSDAPDLPPSILAQAFDGLHEADVVYSPAEDGGFVLIGASRALPSLPSEFFNDIDWSQSHTLQPCLHNAEQLGWHVALTDGWRDVDTFADLLALKNRLVDSEAAPATREWLSKYFKQLK